MSNELAAFGIHAGDVQRSLDSQRDKFLDKYGWPAEVLADYGIMLRPNVKLVDGADGWHEKYHHQLQGYDYADIIFRELDGRPITVYAARASTYTTFRRARLLGYNGPGKYQQYKGTGVAVYLPFDATRPDYWIDIACDPTADLVITEGEFDAISAHYRGMPCMAVTGVSCFMDTKRGTRPVVAHPGDEFVWEGRTVFICFDQDPESTEDEPYKKSVQRGLESLALNLAYIGAKPKLLHIVRSPIGRAHVGEKVGLSEYFKFGGTVPDLMATVEDVSVESTGLLDLLLNYAIMKGDVIDLRTGEILAYHKWALVHAPKSVVVQSDDKIKVIPATQAWLTHSLRRMVTDFTFDPEHPYGLVEESTLFNLWHGFATEAGDLTDPVAMEGVELFESYGERLWGDLWPWVRGLLAHIFQRPGEARLHALILQSPVTGTGKSAFFKLIMQLIGPDHALAIAPDRFFGQFNHLAQGKLIVLFDEAHIVSRKMCASLKDQVTSDTMIVEGKGTNSFVAPWRGVFCMATNESFAVAASQEERRYCQNTPAISTADKVGWQPWVHRTLTLLTGEDSEALRRRGGIAAWLGKEEWLDDYQPKADAPRSQSLELSVVSGLSEKEFAAHKLYAELPDLFVIPPMARGGVGVEVTKYILDQAIGMCTYKTTMIVRVANQIQRMLVCSKDVEIPTKPEPGNPGRRVTNLGLLEKMTGRAMTAKGLWAETLGVLMNFTALKIDTESKWEAD